MEYEEVPAREAVMTEQEIFPTTSSVLIADVPPIITLTESAPVPPMAHILEPDTFALYPIAMDSCKLDPARVSAP